MEKVNCGFCEKRIKHPNGRTAIGYYYRKHYNYCNVDCLGNDILKHPKRFPKSEVAAKQQTKLEI